jgi:hypothetical protein
VPSQIRPFFHSSATSREPEFARNRRIYKGLKNNGGGLANKHFSAGDGFILQGHALLLYRRRDLATAKPDALRRWRYLARVCGVARALPMVAVDYANAQILVLQ